MNSSTFVGLINNAALLLSLGLLYDLLGLRLLIRKTIARQLISGLIAGVIGVAIMLNPWSFGQGVLFDSRSVLLCVTGFFFGAIPALVAVLVTGTFRLFMGGAGAATGMAVILTSALIGLAWRYLRGTKAEKPSFAELYVLGIVVHVALLAWMLSLPRAVAFEVLASISLPVLLIFPLATAILGTLMINRKSHRQAEEALRQSEEKFRNIFQHHSAVKLLIDPGTGAIIEANEAAALFYGWSVDRLKTMRIHDINTVSTEQIAASMEKAGALERTRFEFRHRLADGSIKDVEVYSSRIEIDGRCLLHSIIHDATERKRVAAELRDREYFLRSVVETTADGFWIANDQGLLEDVNNAYCEMSGYSRDELGGMAIRDIDAVETPEVIAHRIERIRARRSEIFQSSHRRRDGSIYPVEISITFIDQHSGKFVCFIRDLTQRQQQEQRISALAGMLDAAPAAIMIHDAEGHLLFVNEATVTMHGYPDKASLCAITLRDLDTPENAALLPLRLREIEAHGEARFEVAHFRLDGSTVPLEILAKSIIWEGRPAFLSIGVDISAGKEAARSITHSNDLLRYVIEHANSAVAVHDRELHYIYVSQRYLERYRVTESEVIGKHHYEVFPDLPQKWRDVHQKALKGVVSRAERDDYLRSDGTVDWTRWECRPWYNADESIGGIIVYTEVITERVRAEEALRQSEEYKRAIIDASPLAIVSISPDGLVLSWNTAAERIFGWREEELLGSLLPIITEDQRETFSSLREEVLAGKSFSKIELTRRRKDGSPVEISLSAAPIRNEDGNTSGILAVIEDITDYKQNERERKKLQVQLNQAQKMESVGRLAGGVAHDYNNMLGVIIGYTEMSLEKIDQGDALYHDLEEVLNAANRSADITRQLLAFSRQQTIAPTVLDLNDAVAGMLKMIRRLIGEDIDLTWHPGAAVWPIFMDPSQLDQIMVNLCVNARDAIDNVGKIAIETGTTVFDTAYCADHYGFEPGEFVLLSVSDNGCGMSKETREHLFEPFYTTKETGKGTGLGLATVYGIVRQNNGFINVYSEPELGTTFSIYLPRHEGAMSSERATELSVSDARGNETILLVEDEQSILTMTTLMLGELGYTVLPAHTPREAMRLAGEHTGTIHLLITDVVMPDMNGRELATSLQQSAAGLKTLFMSGYTANVIAHRGVLKEGVQFIQKPFSRKKLAAKVRSVLDSAAVG